MSPLPRGELQLGPAMAAASVQVTIGSRSVSLGFAGKASERLSSWIFPKQVHGNQLVRASDCEREMTEADGIYTHDDNEPIAIQTADCVPVLIADSLTVAALHCGWRGLAGGMVAAGLLPFAQPDGARAWIGPHICQDCYEVGEDLVQPIRGSLPAAVALERVLTAQPAAGKYRLDLRALTVYQLLAAGLVIENIHYLDQCSFCEDSRWHSYRRDGKKAGRNWSVIAFQS